MADASANPWLSWEGLKQRIERLQRVVIGLSQLTPEQLHARVNRCARAGIEKRSRQQEITAIPFSRHGSRVQQIERLMRDMEENPKHQNSPVGHENALLLKTLIRMEADREEFVKLQAVVDDWDKSFRRALLTQYVRGEITSQECAKRLLDDELSCDLWRIHEGLLKVEQLLNIT